MENNGAKKLFKPAQDAYFAAADQLLDRLERGATPSEKLRNLMSAGKKKSKPAKSGKAAS